MWGTRPGTLPGRTSARFIPTHVGNTPAEDLRSCYRSVHPHACGEHSNTTRKRWLRHGSSPRMWGTHPHIFPIVEWERFIPTHVGNTPGWRGVSCSSSVHPHACGEHPRITMSTGPRIGSSPRMWGTLDPRNAQPPHDRFIPTHVGNT